jgi:hypothetical protein
MKTTHALTSLLALLFLFSCSGEPENAAPEPETETATEVDIWQEYNVGRIQFHNLATTTPGGRITAAIVRGDSLFFQKIARKVVSLLYLSPEDSITRVRNLNIRVEDFDGVAYATGDSEGNVIVLSCRWIGNSFLDTRDTTKTADEITGVLLHEMTHVYQLEPRAPGGYGGNTAIWACIEGTADAVRYLAGYFKENDVGAGGSYLDGYRTTGFFLGWVAKNKDADFLRAFNRAALHVYPWNFAAAFKHALGEEADVDALWTEYQTYRKTVK